MTTEEKIELLNQLNCTDIAHDMLENNHIPAIIALGGSHSYGTNVEGSDIDIRGVYLNSPSEVIGIKSDKEQYVSMNPDLQIYSLKKAMWLMKQCNPAMLEILGCRDEDYIYKSKAGQMLIDSRNIFLSKKAEKTFVGYAKKQLNSLINRSGRARLSIAENEQRSFEKAFMSLAQRHKGYVDQSATIRRDGEDLYLSFTVNEMPVRTVSAILSEFNSIDKDYRKSFRNDKAQTRGGLAKHMMHLIRLYITGAELMSTGEIHTYRDKEHNLLMSIRNGDYLEEDQCTPTKEFEELLADYQRIYEEACINSKLPDEPDMDAINDLVMKINKEFVV